MRLICLNCNAQYEVEASAIPAAGRDVQCSNCGNNWFQQAEAAAAQPMPVAAGPEVAPDAEAADLAPPPLKRRVIDESVLAVLREEAEREAIARRADAATLEMQGELGLTDPPPAPKINLAKAAGPAAVAPAVAAKDANPATSHPGTGPAAQAAPLPDITEINSSLSPSTAEADPPQAGPDTIGDAKSQPGFWSGFGLVLLLAGLCTVIYAAAPQLSRQFPAAADALAAYEADINALRVWVDALTRRAIGG